MDLLQNVASPTTDTPASSTAVASSTANLQVSSTAVMESSQAHESSSASSAVNSTALTSSQPSQPKRKCRKPGNWGNFPPEYLKFLFAHIPEYLALSGCCEKTQWKEKFLTKLWSQFPWHTSVEPPDSDFTDAAIAAFELDSETQQLHSSSASENTEESRITARMKIKQNEIFKAGEIQLHHWFNHQVQKNIQKGGGEAFAAVTKQLIFTVNKNPLWLMADYKFWMSHPDYRPEFLQQYEIKVTGNEPARNN
ncbi:hypothetical protein GYMLUDRAFT_63630 [Collybiopsis luxurians FD-317 M1]|uniref:Uncharacterized protein n=1 Tax=Collybiopsis luxurians FD-317 M1 TaxID=944289 RepID=A0A0D0BFY0_9AGAR|nr:hypothetical protein GYMLUDRAFT_63630 [Collybiopsis luxurians FD-317 M1]